jgi:DNA-binding NarL/FixJ family response regulator
MVGMKKKASQLRPIVSAAARAEGEVSRLEETRRQLLADWCKLVDARLRGKPVTPLKERTDPLKGIHLSPRMQQILAHLLAGDSEKQIASKLQVSVHTVHTYVKRLHKTLEVSSRGELLAKFVK